MPQRRSSSLAKSSKPKGTHPATKAPHINERGEVTSWDSTNPDGKLLKILVEEGLLDKKTASDVKKDYPEFGKYALRTLNSTLTNARNSLKKEVETRMHDVSSGI